MCTGHRIGLKGRKAGWPGDRGTSGRLLRGWVPALCLNGLHYEGLTRRTRQKLVFTAPCSEVVRLLPTPESLLVPPEFSLASLTQIVKVSTDPPPAMPSVTCQTACPVASRLLKSVTRALARLLKARPPWCPAQHRQSPPLPPPCFPSPHHHTLLHDILRLPESSPQYTRGLPASPPPP